MLGIPQVEKFKSSIVFNALWRYKMGKGGGGTGTGPS